VERSLTAPSPKPTADDPASGRVARWENAAMLGQSLALAGRFAPTMTASPTSSHGSARWKGPSDAARDGVFAAVTQPPPAGGATGGRRRGREPGKVMAHPRETSP